jgi:hypothetical protein
MSLLAVHATDSVRVPSAVNDIVNLGSGTQRDESMIGKLSTVGIISARSDTREERIPLRKLIERMSDGSMIYCSTQMVAGIRFKKGTWRE